MSNNTSPLNPPPTATPPGSPGASSPGANTSPSIATPSPTSEPSSSPTQSSTSTPPPPPPPTSSTSSTSSSPPPPPTSSTPTSSSTPPPSSSSVVTSTITSNGSQSTVVVTRTSVFSDPANQQTGISQGPSSTNGGPANPTGGPQDGMDPKAKIAVAVVVPIAAVALLVLAGIFLWRKRKQRKDAEEQRQKEMDDYTYNPNADPTIPAVAGGGYEMKEDGSSGYRGWGSTTLAGSTGRKASTTMSGGAAGGAYSDATSPTRGGVSDSRSGEAIAHDGAHSPEGEILGAMGPSAAHNRGGDVRRGPSNASSSYSAGAHSDGSGEGAIGVAYGDPNYYNQYGSNNPYADTNYGSPQRPSELGSAPIIRDNPARRNTRIENPSHYPQQSAGISQNF